MIGVRQRSMCGRGWMRHWEDWNMMHIYVFLELVHMYSGVCFNGLHIEAEQLKTMK